VTTVFSGRLLNCFKNGIPDVLH